MKAAALGENLGFGSFPLSNPQLWISAREKSEMP